MENITIKTGIIPEEKAILELYSDVDWTAYTDKPDDLFNGIHNSLKVYTVWDDDKLIGLARIVGDGYTIIYIQDILFLENYQGKGLGTKLLKLILDEYKKVRQIVLLTDNTEKTVNYYSKLGLIRASDYDCLAFTN